MGSEDLRATDLVESVVELLAAAGVDAVVEDIVELLVLAAKLSGKVVALVTAASVAVPDLTTAADLETSGVPLLAAASVSGARSQLVTAAKFVGTIVDLELLLEGTVALDLRSRAAGLLEGIVSLLATAHVLAGGLALVEGAVATDGGEGVVGLVTAACRDGETGGGAGFAFAASLSDGVVGSASTATMAERRGDGSVGAANLGGGVVGSTTAVAEEAAGSVDGDHGVTAAAELSLVVGLAGAASEAGRNGLGTAAGLVVKAEESGRAAFELAAVECVTASAAAQGDVDDLIAAALVSAQVEDGTSAATVGPEVVRLDTAASNVLGGADGGVVGNWNSEAADLIGGVVANNRVLGSDAAGKSLSNDGSVVAASRSVGVVGNTTAATVAFREKGTTATGRLESSGNRGIEDTDAWAAKLARRIVSHEAAGGLAAGAKTSSDGSVIAAGGGQRIVDVCPTAAAESSSVVDSTAAASLTIVVEGGLATAGIDVGVGIDDLLGGDRGGHEGHEQQNDQASHPG